MSREENAAPTPDVGALVARADANLLRLIDDLRPYADRSLGTLRIGMDEVRSILALFDADATALQAESARADRNFEVGTLAQEMFSAAEARADREKERADEAERLHKHDRQMWDATRRRAESAEAALTACRQKDRADD